MSETGVRIVTGIGLIALVVAGTVLSEWVFFGVFGGIGLMCLLEFFRVTYSDNPRNLWYYPRYVAGLALGLLPMWTMVRYLLHLNADVLLSGSMTLLLLFLVVMAMELFARAPFPLSNLSFTALGVLYIGFSGAALFYLQHLQHPHVVLGLILLVFMNDSLAYVFGRWKGKTPLFPRISPKKTWEGALGGSLFTMLLAFSYPLLFFKAGPSLGQWLVVGGIVIVLGPIGDLAESLIKRSFSVKDAGSLLPGHGGFLDRFDALIFVVPFVTYYFFHWG